MTALRCFASLKSAVHDRCRRGNGCVVDVVWASGGAVADGASRKAIPLFDGVRIQAFSPIADFPIGSV